MIRRVHVDRVAVGPCPLEAAELRHLRDVLRLSPGDTVEAFDAAGRRGRATLVESAGHWSLNILDALEPAPRRLAWEVISATPKGARAEWMVEKLAELGCAAWRPLDSQRTIVLPAGANKLQRFQRIAQEAAKQSRSTGVMSIAAPITLSQCLDALRTAAAIPAAAPPDAIQAVTAALFCTLRDPLPFGQAMQRIAASLPPEAALRLLILIGPEGGWTDAEESLLRAAGCLPASLGQNILRIETAALAAGALLSAMAGLFNAPA